MDTPALLDALGALCSRLGLPVREQAFDRALFAEIGKRGGLCTVSGERVVLVDESLSPVERAAVLLDALASLPTEHLAMPPYVRERLDRIRRARAAGARRPRLRLIRRP